MFMDITGIDLFDQNVGMACAKVRLRYMANIVQLLVNMHKSGLMLMLTEHSNGQHNRWSRCCM